MRIPFLFFLLCVLSLSAVAQRTPASREFSWHLGYLSNNAVYPGGNIGLEYGLFDWVKLKTKVVSGKGGQNYTKVHQLIAAANLGAVWHPRTSVSILNNYTIEYRKTTKRKMQYQVGLGPGYFRSILPNVYEVDDQGEVQSSFLAGRGYFAPMVFIGFGRYRTGARKLQWWHLRIAQTSVVNYNAAVLPYLTAEVRLGFHKKPIQ